MYQILAINPGSTSTKLALFHDDTQAWEESVSYDRSQLDGFETIIDQYDMRLNDVIAILKTKGVEYSDLSAVVARGGPFKPLQGGTYRVDDDVLSDIRAGRVMADHISNIAAILAHEIAGLAKVEAFFVDPVSVDEFDKLARYSGMKELERRSLVHALNIKATARKAAAALGKDLRDVNVIVAHLGGGISICPLKNGRIIDVNNANEGGPFSPERCGSLP